MFRIGEFSRLARVSCRLLRYYDQLGLFSPGTVDDETGYRYYHASQLARLNRILVLKELGLSLEQIGEVIDERDLSADKLRAMLLERRSEAEQRVAEEIARLRRIESRIDEIDGGGEIGADDVVIRSEPGFAFLCTRRTVSSFDEARAVVGALVKAAPQKLSPRDLGRFVVIVHSPEFEPDAIDAELGYSLVRPDALADVELALPDGGRARVRQVEPVESMATCVRVGLPEDAHAGALAIARRLAADGYTLCGPNREVFLRGPDPRAPEQAVVEMQYPVRPRT